MSTQKQKDIAAAKVVTVGIFRGIAMTREGRRMLNYTFQRTVSAAIARYYESQNTRIWSSAKLKKFVRVVAKAIRKQALLLRNADNAAKVDRPHILKASLVQMKIYKKKVRCNVEKWIDEVDRGQKGLFVKQGPLCDAFLEDPPKL